MREEDERRGKTGNTGVSDRQNRGAAAVLLVYDMKDQDDLSWANRSISRRSRGLLSGCRRSQSLLSDSSSLSRFFLGLRSQLSCSERIDFFAHRAQKVTDFDC